jgi:DNA-directed RNA polymerase specialized sigma24 family protein/DNA-binding XRE family transcriptional regulator
MRFTREFIRQAAQGDPSACRTLWPILVRCAVAGARKAGVHDGDNGADDVAQELWLFFSANYERLNPEYNIEPFLIESARMLGMAHVRKLSTFGTGGMPGEGDDDRLPAERPNQDPFGDSAGFAEPLDDAILDSDRAMKALLLRSPALRKAARSDVKAERERVINGASGAVASGEAQPARRKLAHSLSADHLELRAIRERLSIPQGQMASMVGVKLCTYQVYEYGKAKKVPPRVMDAARGLMAETTRPGATVPPPFQVDSSSPPVRAGGAGMAAGSHGAASDGMTKQSPHDDSTVADHAPTPQRRQGPARERGTERAGDVA